MARRLFPLLLVTSLCCADGASDLAGQPEFSPVALDFGTVAVQTERTLTVQVINRGPTPLEFTNAEVRDDPRGLWRVLRISPQVAPGATGTVDVAYRACPEAWTAGSVNPAFDLTDCLGREEVGSLLLTTAKTTYTLPLSGAPGLAPIAELYCPREVGPDGCPGPIERNAPCSSVHFGYIGLGLSCDAEIEVVNRRRDGARTGDLLVQGTSLRLLGPDDDGPVDGESLGFAFITEAGQPLNASAAQPLTVAIPEGEDEGRVRMKLRFTNQVEGLLAGDHTQGLGLRLHTNSSDAQELRASVYATGVVPEVSLGPVSGQLRVVPAPGQSEVVRLWVRNFGPGIATVDRVRLSPAHPELSIQGTTTNVQIPEGERLEFELVYTRTSTETARSDLIVDLGGPLTDPLILRINLEQGADQCHIEPALLDFGATQGGELNGAITVRSQGPTGCTISDLDIRRPLAGPDGEFTVELPQCQSLPCDPQITLCTHTTADCPLSEMQIPLRYRNQDHSIQDLAELHMTTSQRDAPQRVVVLQAADEPCVPPTPIITLQTTRPCAGQPVVLDGLQSSAGGRAGSAAAIVDYRWQLAFSQKPGEFMPPNAAQTSITPESGGLLSVSLSVTNSCGQTSQTPAQEQILVQNECP